MRRISEKFSERVSHVINFFPLGYLALLFLLHLFYLSACPIQAGDTDLWYHLDGGRYMFTHHALPHNSYFSFIAPSRAWVDYYWLFQVLVYAIYSGWAYYGLIVLRAAAYLSTLAVITGYLFKGSRARTQALYPCVIAGLYFIVLLPRSLLVRPHLATYFFIVTFLYLLEFQPRRRKILPVLAILWCNLHGIAYPLMLLVAGAYAAEYFVDRIKMKGRRDQEQDARQLLVPVVLSMLAIYATPHGFQLLGIPFTPLRYTSQIIGEFQPVYLKDLLTFGFIALTPSYGTAANLLLITACLAMLISTLKNPPRIAHLISCAGGLFLLTKGSRFLVEAALLSLPVLTANPLLSARSFRERFSISERVVVATVTGMLLAGPLLLLKQHVVFRRAYPFSHRGLPQGVSVFLEQIHASGAVLNDSNAGGYLRWMAYPRYKIFMDLEVPPFTAEDLFMATNVFHDKETFRKVVVQYAPPFIAAPIGLRQFPGLIASFPDYTMIFFDDTAVLYVNKRRYPVIAQHYELKGVDPFGLVVEGAILSIIDKHGEEPLLRYLPRLLDIDPNCGITHEVAARLYNREGAYDRALPHAEALVSNFPELPQGYTLLGDAFAGLNEFERALECYERALKRSPTTLQAALYKQIGSMYRRQRRYSEAYHAFRRGVDVLSLQTASEDLYNLGSSALSAGRRKEAEAILRYLYHYRLAHDDAALAKKVTQDLMGLGIETNSAR